MSYSQHNWVYLHSIKQKHYFKAYVGIHAEGCFILGSTQKVYFLLFHALFIFRKKKKRYSFRRVMCSSIGKSDVFQA